MSKKCCFEVDVLTTLHSHFSCSYYDGMKCETKPLEMHLLILLVCILTVIIS